MIRNQAKKAYSVKMRFQMRVFLSFIIAVIGSGGTEVSTTPAMAAEPALSSSSQLNRMAIIIDDVGNDMRGTAEILDMPVKLTVAVMPFLQTTKKDAIAAHEKGMDVIVHMPMEPKKGKPEWLGPGAITSNLTDEQVRERVEKAIDDVPYAIGMNNHMGSKITSDKRIMSVVLDVCRERGLFFVDSRTNFRSVVGDLAITKNMPPVGNDIFLDDQNSKSHIRKQLDLAAQRAVEKKSCVVIGHVGHTGMNTSAVLRESVSRLQNQVQFVGIGDMVRDVWHWQAAPTLPKDNK
ncbi:divergent polysaccharide deacetylase family protein [Paenibacillus polysaccharolyticus]|uniref:divergent polysaccharide deacetylase family protein n=1 Tax=Paenibacillus polysaccharolyticus TaxID=582692 RepID=UPI002041DEC8|nr:divergent polysaccharide deacetylase family protein [Paenibacillus polysaccharolyticus]MCM3131744.1 divergent polysaccharide deacetylase family protein [Paenibacillus polysaccharolyticus]